MSTKMEEKVEEPVNTIKQKCVNCVKGQNLIQTIVVIICVAVAFQQVLASLDKLIVIPITTYTHFDFNQTILYPSLTFCREPPYKFDKLLEYGLNSHPRFTSTWRNYNYSGVPLDFLWTEITYDTRDFFAQYGMNGLADNVEITSTLGFVLGRCYTLTPKDHSTRVSMDTGYSITLKHNSADVAASSSIYPPGYHVFIHYHKEPYTEVEVYNGGLVDYLYLNVGETIMAKLTVDQYVKISTVNDPCSHSSNYSANACTAHFVWRLVEQQANCSSPWMISRLPHCKNYSGMRSLISAYMNTYQNHNCTVCPRVCRSYMYNAYVVNRQVGNTWDSVTKQWLTRSGDAVLQMQLYVYFNSMMVSVHEERYNYDWNLFLADLGGSIGFLLGLSVVSCLTIAGKVWSTLVTPMIKVPKKKDTVSITSSTEATINNIFSKEEEYLKKCNDWNLKNNFGYL